MQLKYQLQLLSISTHHPATSNNCHSRNCHTEPQSSPRPDYHARYFQNKKMKSSCPCTQTQHTYRAVDLCIEVDINPVFLNSASSQLIRVLWTPLGSIFCWVTGSFLPLHYFSGAIRPQCWSSAGVSGCLNQAWDREASHAVKPTNAALF